MHGTAAHQFDEKIFPTRHHVMQML